jgi:hypothetical protein
MPSLRTLAAAAASLVFAGCASGDLTIPGDAAGDGPQPASLTAVGGDDQRAKPGELLDQPVMVQVKDASGLPVEGVTVQFAFLGGDTGGTLDPATTATDVEGRAAAKVRLGTVPGEQVILAAVPEPVSLSARFTATATPGRANGGGSGGSGEQD